MTIVQYPWSKARLAIFEFPPKLLNFIIESQAQLRKMSVYDVRQIFLAYADHCIATGERPAGCSVEYPFPWWYERQWRIAEAERKAKRLRRAMRRAA